MTAIGPLWLLGAGKLGGALRGRWQSAGLAPVGLDTRRGDTLPAGATGTLVIAVKPQAWRAAVAPLAPRLAGMRVVSVMVGIRAAALGAALPGATVVRAMPNTPVAVGRGMTGLFGAVGEADRAAVAALFAPTGSHVWLDDEDAFDALGAVSGSGPAYVYALVEALAGAGAAAGLAPALAARLAAATVTGAAALLTDGADPAALRAAVTSPHGTTAAGLAVLLPGLGPLLRDTVAAAAARSRELGKTG